ncbi:lipoprotein [Streptomyces sp. CC210A]|uniref:lipoprotein n=1 Tax=Streptomyces sp. CC210A TaxID=2898184 RepID=UPI001F356624|nr:lipoprotein [Streptomyces sp. CC210A]
MVVRGAAAAGALVVGLLLAGCATAPEPAPGKASAPAGGEASGNGRTAGPGADAGQGREGGERPGAVAAGGAVGAPGSACPLPVTFDLAAGWKPKAVAPPEGEQEKELFEALAVQGPVTTVCEIDAKPAGHIGFLRVYVNDDASATARATLEAFVAAETAPSGAVYREVRAGTLTATEVTYVTTVELLDRQKKSRALAVATPRGAVVLSLGGMDDAEHEAMLPAFELARSTLAPAPAEG